MVSRCLPGLGPRSDREAFPGPEILWYLLFGLQGSEG